MTATITMSTLYNKLRSIGFTKNYIRKQGLPSWWDEELEDKPLAVLEGAGHIAQRLNLDLKSLLSDNQEPQFKQIPHTKFKYRTQDKTDIPDIAYKLASRVAEVVTQATSNEYKSIPFDPNQVRSQILAKYSQVNLESLLDYCWEHNIAVVYFNGYPKNIRKITGMIQWQSSQPIIVLSSGKKNPAWLAFHLAHELGHLALGHLKQGAGILIDTQIDENSNDDEEIESNQFAKILLVDKYDNHFKDRRIFNNHQLIKQINKITKKDPTIDPCMIAFNYAWHSQKYGIAEKAVQKIDCAKDGHKKVNNVLSQHIDWENLSEDNIDYLEQILEE